MGGLLRLLVAAVQLAHGVSENAFSAISPRGRILRVSPKTQGVLASAEGPTGAKIRKETIADASRVSIFIITTPDDQHQTMLRNMLCSLLLPSGGQSGRHNVTVMLHPGDGNTKQSAEELQHNLRSLGYGQLSVLDGQKLFGDHPHWNSLKRGFPSNLRVLGIRHVLARMPRGSQLLVIDEDVVCSPERTLALAGSIEEARAEGERVQLSVPDAIAARAPAGAAVVCAHEVPGVIDEYNNGFCLYRAADATEKLLVAVESRMTHLGFTGDQTPFNQILREAADKSASKRIRGFAGLAATFDVGVVGYLRTWSSEGFPDAGKKELFVVDSRLPESLVQWSATAPMLTEEKSSHASLAGPLCIHYLPFSPKTRMWSKFERQC